MTFPQDVLELQALLRAGSPGQRVQAVPGAGTERAAVDPRIEPLRRAARRRTRPSLRVRLALRAGRSCCRHCNIYRSRFKPSEQLDRPHAMVGVNIIAAETDARRAACDRRSRCHSPTSSAARGSLASRRSTTSRPIGRR